MKPAAKPPAKPIFTQLESIRQAAAQKAQQQQKITEVVQVLQAMNREGLISQNLFTVPAFLSSYTPEKLEVLLHQLKIFIELAKDDASLNRVIQTWQAEDEKSGIFISPGDAEFIQVKMGGRLGLLWDMFKYGPQKTKDILRNVTEIYKRETTKRFIQKDWKKDLDIPQRWNKMNVDNNNGVKYRAPENPNFNEVRVMKADPTSQWASQRVDYVKIMRNGQYRDINGNVVLSNSAEAHIPLSQLKNDIKELIKNLW